METNHGIKRCTINDLDQVQWVMTDPDVYPFISDDGSPAAEEFPVADVLKNDANFVLMPNAGSVFLFSPFSYKVFMVHTCVVDGYRGKLAIESGRMVTNWMFENAGAIKIISVIPKENRAALMFAFRCGYKKEGHLKKAWVWRGRVMDLIIVGREKPCQQQQ